MTPVLRHVQNNLQAFALPFKQSPSNWTFKESIDEMGVAFFREVVPLHPALTLEYSILCLHIKHNLDYPHQTNQQAILEQLAAALMLSELLEHIHRYYLIVPREVARLCQQQNIYRSLLTELGGYVFTLTSLEQDALSSIRSLTQEIREDTAWVNWFRLLLTRSKRVLNFLDLVGTGSDSYHRFVGMMDNYTNPFFAYLSWCFFLPRLITNSYLLLKHTIPWPNMSKKEQALGLGVRMTAQLQRRWFELANDIIWITVGVLNCFVFAGPIAVYASLLAFVLDVILVSLRAWIELRRLYQLHAQYTAMGENEQNPEEKKAIMAFKLHLNRRIEFEAMRFSLSISATTAVFLAMFMGLPSLAINPIVPFIGSLILIAIWAINFYLTRVIESHRPNDAVTNPSSMAHFSFFKKKPEREAPSPAELNHNDSSLADTRP